MKILVATSLYEAARPFLADWIDGVKQSAVGNEVAVLSAVDGFHEPFEALATLGSEIKIHLADAGRPDVGFGSHISFVRATMLSAAQATDADVIVFCDADDVLTPSAISLHVSALTNADISVGDLQPIGTTGNTSGNLMLRSALPKHISRETIEDTNICGFSNTAVRRKSLSHTSGLLFPSVTAVDWWLFATLLASGCTAHRAEGAVALYRQHTDNLLGSGRSSDLSDSIRRLRMRADHYRAIGTDTKAEIAEKLLSKPELLRQIIMSTPQPMSAAWHADTASWCNKFLSGKYSEEHRFSIEDRRYI